MVSTSQPSFPTLGSGTRGRWITALLLFGLTGCGDGPPLTDVKGTLLHKGKPVPNALISFMPEHGRPSQGITDDQGHFTLNYDRGHEGAMLGKHTVSLKPRPVTQKEQEAVMAGKKMPLPKEMAGFFDKYSPQNSKYQVTIDKNTTELKLDLD